MLSREMKDSGVEWIGEIPTEWSVSRLKNNLWERKEMNNPIKTNNILSLTKNRGVILYSEKGEVGNKSKDDLSAYKLVYPGDIVLNSMNVIIGSVNLSSYYGIVSPVYYMLNTRRVRDDIRYYNYIFQTTIFQKMLTGYGNGILAHRMRIPMIKLNTVMLPNPSEESQKKIADILDGKITSIDKIISETQQSIIELKKYKQSLITEAVTKGLDKNAEMKDSGVHFLGEIPKRWNLTKIKYSYEMVKGLSITKENLESAGIPVISYGEIHSKYGFKFDPKKNPVKNVNPKYLETNENALIKKGDYIYADTSEDIEGSGNFTCYVGEEECFAGYHTIILKPKKKENYSFYAYLYDSLSFRYQIQNKVKGIKVYSITQKILKELYRWAPPENEQQQIVDFLDEKTSKIDSLIKDKEQIIKEYEEYKKSLIYEYVTGKKQV
ncbi:restriction endonuclease subunit S [Vagococcus fluvialis]|uniref:restriction endonuclease subunit S n=1 Tax=Vagococcus fluvialis TaxID=2738 RepID=UPI002B2CAB6A|nr:restriction endonuclease subunit S [Vagococcus fluvialis]